MKSRERMIVSSEISLSFLRVRPNRIQVLYGAKRGWLGRESGKSSVRSRDRRIDELNRIRVTPGSPLKKTSRRRDEMKQADEKAGRRQGPLDRPELSRGFISTPGRARDCAITGLGERQALPAYYGDPLSQ
ncbi:hypothetical protein RRG08_030148 [Elysia crispata]|uniref:Uncharacterized protein n=1 Tax=Elysia crispata TaxID=231223 RepID=A0AAE0ZS70_9GAST|nr:hypothetical protein RRG08_030148 [Elysia crispata]